MQFTDRNLQFEYPNSLQSSEFSAFIGMKEALTVNAIFNIPLTDLIPDLNATISSLATSMRVALHGATKLSVFP